MTMILLLAIPMLKPNFDSSSFPPSFLPTGSSRGMIRKSCNHSVPEEGAGLEDANGFLHCLRLVEAGSKP